MSRNLTEQEKQFVAEAEKEYFSVLYTEDGKPYAMGASGTGNLFTMDVEETPDPLNEGSCYMLRA